MRPGSRLMVAEKEEEEDEAEVVVVKLVVCSIDGLLEAGGCYIMIFGKIH